MWLPEDVCDRFEKSFGLTYDNMTDLYTINDTMHKQMLDLDPSITISLGESSDPAKRVNIVLPYGAFDVQASYPYYKDAVNYFPLRRAQNDTQYTLGRVVLQEMYLVTDYSRGEFSVHQALFPGTNEEQQITPIYVPGEEPKPEPTADKPSNTPSGSPTPEATAKQAISGGAIGGIVAGSIAGVGAFGFLAFFLLRRRRSQSASKDEHSDRGLALEGGSSHAGSGMHTPNQFDPASQYGFYTGGPGYPYEKTAYPHEVDGAPPVAEMEGHYMHTHELEPQNTIHEIGLQDGRKEGTDVKIVPDFGDKAKNARPS
jgi:hypothetical protein